MPRDEEEDFRSVLFLTSKVRQIMNFCGSQAR